MSKYKPATQLTGYQQTIVQDSGCPPEQAAEVEEVMRAEVVHGELDHLTARAFRECAREAWAMVMTTRAEERSTYDIEMGQGGAGYNDIMFGDSGD